MSTGSKLDSPPAESAERAFDAEAFARSLLALPGVREVKAAVNAILLEVDCTARNEFDGEMEQSGEELDSGTWFLIRVTDLPGPEARGGLVSFVREAKLSVDKGAPDVEQ